MELAHSHFINKYQKSVVKMLQVILPNAPKKELKGFVSEIIEKNIHIPQAQIHNNYVHKRINLDLLTLTEFIHENKPIIAGAGTLFKNQNLAKNPNAKMLDVFMKLRKKEKKKLDYLIPDSFEYMMADLSQLNEKVNANAFYGCNGAKTARFFNIYTAAAVTATGQALISTTEQAFEAFLSGGYKYKNMNEVYMFVSNVVKQKKKLKADFLSNVSVEMVMERIQSNFYDPKKYRDDNLFSYLIELSQEDLNRIYYKNNLYEFMRLPRMRFLIRSVLHSVEEFIDPNDVPDAIKDKLTILYMNIGEFVLYNHSPISRVERVKNDKRSSVSHVDTDSNMIYLYPWIEFLFNEFIDVDSKLNQRDTESNVYIGINVMAYVLTRLITDVLENHTNRSNILKEYQSKINMKNEFLFWKMVFTDKKKRYMSLIRLREGNVIDPPKLDVKGLDFMKSTTRARTKEKLIDITRKNIMDTENISIPAIFKELEDLENEIIESLMSGSKEYLIPASVKEFEAYKDPMRIQGFKAVYVWNIMFPDQAIQLPSKIDIVKVRMNKLEDIADMQETMPEQYKALRDKIFNGNVKSFRSNGVDVIAVPHEKIPDWLKNYIDYQTITNNNMSRYLPVAKALGIEIIQTSKINYYTNILEL